VLAATGESLYVHVDTAAGRSAPLPEDRQARVDALVAAHAGLPRPDHLGRGVGART
jgi:acyl-CoA thioester hydrolase